MHFIQSNELHTLLLLPRVYAEASKPLGQCTEIGRRAQCGWICKLISSSITLFHSEIFTVSFLNIYLFVAYSPGQELPEDATAPIDYVTLERWHLPQIHDLLSRIFWPGIDGEFGLEEKPSLYSF